MSTIDSRRLIRILLENNGVFIDDPQVASIWSYINDFRKKTYAVFYGPDHDMYDSPSVRNPVLLFDAVVGLTEDGKKELEVLQKS